MTLSKIPTNRQPYAFQSTSSVWRMTFQKVHIKRADKDFNPHPPCGGWPCYFRALPILFRFQSTSSVWRMTNTRSTVFLTYHGFQSTSSVWRMTKNESKGVRSVIISIDISSGGNVKTRLSRGWLSLNFNPHPPCGGWRKKGKGRNQLYEFQSTSSVWRMTG